jgi:hypothetical protein
MALLPYDRFAPGQLVEPALLAQHIIDILRMTGGNRPTYLATLGSLIARRFGHRSFRQLSVYPLSHFIQLHLKEQVEVVSDQSRPLVLSARLREVTAILPLLDGPGSGQHDAPSGRANPLSSLPDGPGSSQRDEQPGPTSAIESREAVPHADQSKPTEIAPSTLEPPRQRFSPNFWAAFSKPLTGGKRFLRIIRPFEFSHQETEDPPGDEYRDVRPDLIAPAHLPPGPERSALVYSNISKWLEEQRLDSARFLYVQNPASFRQSKAGVLANLLSTLDKSDQQRISIPTDVWVSLFEL